MSSPYVKLGDRSLDQWRVTELKEELKRRRLPIKGLKEELVKRLDQALRSEMEDSAEELGNGLINTEEKELSPEEKEPHKVEEHDDTLDITVKEIDDNSGSLGKGDIDDSSGSLGKGNIVDGSLVHEADASGLQDNEICIEATEMKVETVEEGSKGEKPDSSDQPLENQVSAVDLDLGIQVKSDSTSTEALSILEKNELMLDINDNVNIESDVKLEMEQHSVISTVSVAGESHPMDVVKPLHGRDLIEKNVDSGDLGPHEKLSLEGSSGDDSMGEAILDKEQIYDKPNLNGTEEDEKKSDLPKQEEDVDIVGHDKPVNFKGPIPDANEEVAPVTAHAKRKFDDHEGIGNNDSLNKTRRVNLEGSKVSEPQAGTAAPSKRAPAIDPAVNNEAAEGRHVPPPNKPPTNSLRIDQFLRPFTLKAVQELLGKTGTVTNFWMDQIKTHCYVSYTSVEEAIETRNAVYNLQWPTNGGRMLIAEFVDPQEVKSRLEAPPSTPLSATPTPQQPKSSQQVAKNHLPPPPPPPVLAEPPLGRGRPPPTKERLGLAPPPPPATEKLDPPIVTLDDIFKKTRATPRIYYLPLSDEEVAAKVESRGKTVVN